MSSNHLELWDAVRTPDPAFTKAFSRGGGFKGTATNVVYLIRRATEQWGPMGGRWGVEIVSDQYINGAPILVDGAVVCTEILHVIIIKLRHPGGEVPGIGQTLFVGRNKNGLFTDEEAPKKSLTDALSKALSWLGFAADIHLGLWDDNKYVNDVRAQFAESEAATRTIAPSAVAKVSPQQAATIDALLQRAEVDTSTLLDWIGGKVGYAVADLADIPASAYTAVTHSLNKSITKKEQA